MFEDITIGLLWLATTWFIANLVIGIREGLATVKIEARREVVKYLDEIVHRVREERHGDVIYWFDQDDNEFLAQGRTQQELIDVVKSRFPDHVFYLTDTVFGRGQWEPRKIDIAELVRSRS